MATLAYSLLSDEVAAEEIAKLPDPQMIELGSATIYFGALDEANSKLIITTSTGKCAAIDNPFAGKDLLV